MKTRPKGNTTLRIDATLKAAATEVLASHGMTLTEGIEEYLSETAYRGEPAVREGVEAHLAWERARFEQAWETESEREEREDEQER
jgi:hypothetical protein